MLEATEALNVYTSVSANPEEVAVTCQLGRGLLLSSQRCES